MPGDTRRHDAASWREYYALPAVQQAARIREYWIERCLRVRVRDWPADVFGRGFLLGPSVLKRDRFGSVWKAWRGCAGIIGCRLSDLIDAALNGAPLPPSGDGMIGPLIEEIHDAYRHVCGYPGPKRWRRGRPRLDHLTRDAERLGIEPHLLMREVEAETNARRGTCRPYPKPKPLPDLHLRRDRARAAARIARQRSSYTCGLGNSIRHPDEQHHHPTAPAPAYAGIVNYADLPHGTPAPGIIPVGE